MVDRRSFMAMGAAGAALSLVGVPAGAQAAARVRRTVILGKTGLKVSDVAFGSASSSDPELVRYAFDRGVTLFDSAESYRSGAAEEAIGEALRGKRQSVVLTSKTKAGARDTRQEMMQALEGSLKRLRTDYVDIYFNHAVNDVERMRNQEWWAFTDLAKRQGKIRFRGMSGHGSQLAACLEYAIDNNLVDVILAAYSFAQDPSFYAKLKHTFHFVDLQPDLSRLIAKAKQKQIGVLAMKTLMGGRVNDMRPYERPGGTFAQAAFRWTLANSNVDALLISMTSKDAIDEYLGGSGGTKVSQADFELLARYAALNYASQCQSACRACESTCPAEVAIREVLRSRMYAVDYRDEALARSEYAILEANAAACASCTHQACLTACPKGIPIARWTIETHARLATL